MLATGLSAADYVQYMATLARSHTIKVTVQILAPNDHAVVSTISHLMLDGQVDCEALEGDKAAFGNTRTAILRFLDPNRTLAFEASSPVDGAVYFDRMMRVIYSVYTGRADNGGWVDVPVMTGPIVNLQREGSEVIVEAHGKEEYGLGQAGSTLKYSAGAYKVDVIRSLLQNMGELNKFISAIPSGNGERQPKAAVVAANEALWPFASQVAQGTVRGGYAQRLFYDSRGQGVLRPVTLNPVMTMRSSGTGDGDVLVTSDVKLNYSLADLKNVVKVTGRTVAGGTAVISSTAVAPSTHPLSPYRLGRNGKKRTYLLEIDNPQVIGASAAAALAKSTLNVYLSQKLEATWECLPVPHLEPWDAVNLVTDKFSAPIPCRRFTLPLVVGPSMTIGATRPVKSPRRS